MEKLVNYTKPENSDIDPEFRHHKFTIEKNGEVISGAEVQYFSQPLPLYQVSALWTDYEQKSQGLATAVMDKVEEFLIERKKPGILVEAIESDVPEVYGMYQRRGWKEIEGTQLLSFNLPTNIDPKKFIGYSDRGHEV